MRLRVKKVKALTRGGVAKKADSMSAKLERKGYDVVDMEFSKPRFGSVNNHAYIKYRKADNKEA